MTTLTFESVEQLNTEVSRLRSFGMAVRVRKTETGFVAEVNEGGQPASTPRTSKPRVSVGAKDIYFYNHCDYEVGVEAAANLRAQGKKVHYFKSPKCWVLKIVG